MTGSPAITFADGRMRVHFTRFDLSEYPTFLRCKEFPESDVRFLEGDETYVIEAPARFADLLGVARPADPKPPLPFLPCLLDDQRWIVGAMLDAKRYAVWADCGLGKTLIGLEAARQVNHRTGGRTLIATLNEIVPQWIDEARKFYGEALPVVALESRDEMREWCARRGGPAADIAVVNYEKFNHKRNAADQVVPELKHLACFVADEGSRLNTPGGVQKWAIIKGTEGIEHRYILTATPAPNDWAEFCSQAGFLGYFRNEQSVTTFLSRDDKTHRWTVKPHARQAFFKFLASFSIYVRNPKRYGWRLGQPDVPAPEYVRTELAPTPEQQDEAARILAGNDAPARSERARDGRSRQGKLVVDRLTNTIERMKLSQVAKGFVYERPDEANKSKRGPARRIPSHKPDHIGGIVQEELGRDAQVLVWTEFDAETDLLVEELRARALPFEVLTGRTKKAARAQIIERFRRGETPALVSRSGLLGYGMNFQFCTAMVFSGWSDSYVAFYQAVRRAVRHGQTDRVRVYLPFVRGLEDETLENLDAKAARQDAAVAEMEAQYVRVFGRNVA